MSKVLFKVFLSIIIVIGFFTILSFRILPNVERDKSERIKAKASEALQYCKKHHLDTSFCILIDMKIHSGKNRLFVFDFQKGKSVKKGLVSHGCGINAWAWDETKTNPVFSNTPESHLSSLGKYAIKERGWSNWGINVNYKLDGLEASNSNARKRVIVLHSWDEVPNMEIYPDGTPEGWGCPAVSNEMMKYLDKKLKQTDKDVLLWIFR